MRNAPRQEEFLRTYDECADAVFRLCYAKTSSREEALDLTQEAFTRLWRELARGREIHTLRAFLFTIARNLVKDYYKRKKPLLERDLPEGALAAIPTVSTEAESAETALIIAALGKLPDPYRESVMLHFVEGIPIGEIAELLGERPNTISVRVKRGIEKARKTLGITHA